MIITKRHQKIVQSLTTQCATHGLDDIGQMCLNNALVKILKRLELAELRITKNSKIADCILRYYSTTPHLLKNDVGFLEYIERQLRTKIAPQNAKDAMENIA